MSCHLSQDHWLLSLGRGVRKQNLGLRVLAASGMSLAECPLFSLLGSRLVLCHGSFIKISSWFTTLTSAMFKPP